MNLSVAKFPSQNEDVQKKTDAEKRELFRMHWFSKQKLCFKGVLADPIACPDPALPELASSGPSNENTGAR